MTSEEPKRNDTAAEMKPLFTNEINPLLTDLFYPSESDEPIETVTCYLSQEEPLTVSHIKDWLMLPPAVYVAEMPENDFWTPVTTEQDWYGDEEKARTARFQELKKRLEDELTGRQGFRVGEIEIDVYLLGRQADGVRAGLKTKIVQT